MTSLGDCDLLTQHSAIASIHDVLREVSPAAAAAAVLDVGVPANDRRQAAVLPAADDQVVVRLGAAPSAAAGGVSGARTSVAGIQNSLLRSSFKLDASCLRLGGQ